MIDKFELMFDEATLKQEIIDLFDEFDPTRWDLGAGTDEAFEEHLASGEPIEDFYREEIGFVYQSFWNQSTNDERRKYLAMRKFAFDHSYTSAMDYGCGVGVGPVTLALAGLEKVIGAEINKPCLKVMRARKKRLDLENMTVLDIYGKGTRHMVDLLICTEVLEHVEDPVGLMHKLHKRIKPGGAAILSWSFVKMPTHLPEHFDKGWQHTHPDRITLEGFGKEILMDELGMEYISPTWFNNTAWRKPVVEEDA